MRLTARDIWLRRVICLWALEAEYRFERSESFIVRLRTQMNDVETLLLNEVPLRANDVTACAQLSCALRKRNLTVQSVS